MRIMDEDRMQVDYEAVFFAGDKRAVSRRAMDGNKETALAITAYRTMGDPLKGPVKLHLATRVNSQYGNFGDSFDVVVRVSEL